MAKLNLKMAIAEELLGLKPLNTRVGRALKLRFTFPPELEQAPSV